MIEMFIVKFTRRITGTVFNDLLNNIGPEKRRKIQRFSKWQDAHRALLAELLIRKIICEKFELSNDEITFTANECGKPFLNNPDDFHFNLSHSGDWIVCAIDNKSIGIDIEKIQSIDLGIAKRYFSKEEYADLLNQDKNNITPYFFTLWTLKESYIKAIGKGLSLPLNSFSIKLNNGNIKLKLNGEYNNHLFLKQYQIDEQYKMGVCGLNSKFPVNPVQITMDEIINYFS